MLMAWHRRGLFPIAPPPVRFCRVRAVCTRARLIRRYLKDSPYWTFYAPGSSGLEIRYSKIDAKRTQLQVRVSSAAGPLKALSASWWHSLVAATWSLLLVAQQGGSCGPEEGSGVLDTAALGRSAYGVFRKCSGSRETALWQPVLPQQQNRCTTLWT